MKKILFILLCVSLLLNQAGRIDLQNGVAFTFLDVAVFLFFLYGFAIRFKEVIRRLVFLPKPLLFFFLAALVSAIWNFHMYTIFQNIVAILYFIRLCVYVSLSAIILVLFPEKQDKLFIVRSLTITGILILAAGFVQYFFYSTLRNLYYLGWDDHLYRLFSTFFDPNFAGAFYVLFFIWLASMLFRRKSQVFFSAYFAIYALLAVDVVAIFLTFSRSALISLLLGAAILFWMQKKIRNMMLLVGGLILLFIIVSPKLNVENTDYFRVASTIERLETASNSWKIIQKNPVFGVGFDAYRYAQEKLGYRIEKTYSGAISHADAGSDNSILFLWATTGSLGLIFFIWSLVRLYRNAYRKRDASIFSVMFCVSLLAIGIDSLFINSLFYPTNMLWLSILYGLIG